MRRESTCRTLALLVAMLLCAAAPAARAAQVTNAGDSLRTGWYPDQSALTPQLVTGGTFGELAHLDLAIGDQVDAQPLVADDTLIVGTEKNQLYGLDPRTAAQRWHQDLGAAVDTVATTDGCAVPSSRTGLTSTPVIDTATHTAYVFYKRYVSGNDPTGPISYYADAFDTRDGTRRAGFPVAIEGFASQNIPGPSGPVFTSRWELQRPGLLLLDGVVYAAFAGHCDKGHYEGWVVGVSTSTKQVTARWVDVSATPGAGIWQSGGGLVSDGTGRIIFTSGNARTPTGHIPGATPPDDLGESVVRLEVQPDKTLRAADFFTPYDAATTLDPNDVDFGSGGPMALPDAYFGSPAHPHLMVAAGKQGYVYLLDRDHLGGIGEGTGGGDDVVQRAGPIGGVWSRPSVWPGDGGHIWVNTASARGSASGNGGSSGALEVLGYGNDTAGTPKLVSEAQSGDSWSIDAGAPVITSDGVRDGSGIVWIEWAPYGGSGAQLRAYSAKPNNDGSLHLLGTWPMYRSSKFQPPGVAAGGVYVTSRGCASCSPVVPPRVRIFGSPVTQPVNGQSLDFPNTNVGSASTLTETLTATKDLTVTAISSSDAAVFAIGSPSRALPAHLTAGQTVSVPVTFRPGVLGPAGATLTAATDAGNVQLGLSGNGVSDPPVLRTIVPVSFGGVVVGRQASQAIKLYNDGRTPLHVTAWGPPSAPFGVDGPAPTTIAPSSSVVVDLTFDPTTVGDFTDTLHIESDGGNQDVALSGSAATAPHVVIDPVSLRLDFGTLVLGQSVERSFSLTNTGGSPATLSRSQGPLETSAFHALDPLLEGSAIQPGETRTVRIRFTPTAAGPATDAWSINAGDDQGRRDIAFTGSAVPLESSGGDLGAVVKNGTATRHLTFTAHTDITVTGVASSDGSRFVVGAVTPAPPVTLHDGDTLDVPVTFAPDAVGPLTGVLAAFTDAGRADIALSGVGTEPPPVIVSPPPPVAGQGVLPPPDTTPPAVRLARRGTRLGVTVDGPATVRLEIRRVTTVRCPRRLPGGARPHPPCTKQRVVRTITRGAPAAGTLRLALPRLSAGRYVLAVTATDPAGNASRPRTLTYTVKRPAKRRR